MMYTIKTNNYDYTNNTIQMCQNDKKYKYMLVSLKQCTNKTNRETIH